MEDARDWTWGILHANYVLYPVRGSQIREITVTLEHVTY